VLDEVGQKLKRWLGELSGSPEVRFQLPGADSPAPAIGLYFVEIQHKPPVRDATHSARPFHLRYLVTASASDPLAAQRLLGNALIAAIEREGVELDNEPPSIALWQALGVRPQPAFLISVPWQYEKELPRPSLVTQPVELRVSTRQQPGLREAPALA
jgi:hypothetical protein